MLLFQALFSENNLLEHAEPLLLGVVRVREESIVTLLGVDLEHVVPSMAWLFALSYFNRLCYSSFVERILTASVANHLVLLPSDVLYLAQGDHILRLVLSVIFIVDNSPLVKIIDEESLDELGQVEQ